MSLCFIFDNADLGSAPSAASVLAEKKDRVQDTAA
jgi:hypothetical protein